MRHRSVHRSSPTSSPSSGYAALAAVSRTATLVALFACASLTLASQAAAQQDATTVQQMQAADADAQMDAAARARYRVGITLYESGRFAESAREFEGAYELSHRPELLFNVYVANRDDNNLDKAVPALRAYLAAMPAALPNRINLQARLEAMEATLAERATAAQQSDAQAAEVAAAHERAAAAEAAQREEALRNALPEPGFQLSIPGVIIGGVGVAAAIGGFVVGALALGKVSDLEAMCPNDVCPASARGTYDSAQTLVTASDILVIGGAVLAAAGLTMVLLGIGAPGDNEAGATAMASCGPTGCIAGVTGRF